MSRPALTQCPTPTLSQRLSGSLLTGLDGTPALHRRKKAGIPREEWRLSWEDRNAEELADLRDLVEAAGLYGGIAWESPGSGAERVFIISDYADAATSAAAYRIDMTLKLCPGVAP